MGHEQAVLNLDKSKKIQMKVYTGVFGRMLWIYPNSKSISTTPVYLLFFRRMTNKNKYELLMTEIYPATSYSKAHPPRNSILFANHRESISRKPLERSDTPPASVMHHSVFTDEYWQCFNTLDDDDTVTMTTAQHARAAASGPPAWPPRGARSECATNPHHDPFCGRYRRGCGSIAAR
jgi:hypothetical protein